MDGPAKEIANVEARRINVKDLCVRASFVNMHASVMDQCARSRSCGNLGFCWFGGLPKSSLFVPRIDACSLNYPIRRERECV